MLEMSWCAGTAALALLVGALSLRLWAWDPRNPIALGWDHTQISMQLRDIHDHGWYGSNPDIGFPFGQNGSWFPELNVIHVAAIKAIDLVVGNGFTAGSLYFVLSFPLTAITTYLLFRSQGLSRRAGLLGGVLLANAPGHADRFGHLYLAQYWVVPVALWLVLEVGRGRPLLSAADESRSRWLGGRTLVALAAIVVVGLSGVYYVAFTMILLVVATLARRVVGSPADLLRGLGVVVAMAGLIAIPLAVARLGTSRDLVTGRVPAQRAPSESELFAGKLMDLLLPWTEHRIDTLRFLTFVYNGTTRATVEESALGVVGVAGLVGLTTVGLLALLVGRRLDADLGRWAGLTLVSFMFYTVGGLGAFVAYFATGQVRTWSRMSLYILAFALLAVGWWLTRLQRRRGAVVAGFVTALLVVGGSLDQTNSRTAPDHAAVSAEMDGMRTYTSMLEDAVGAGCAVFQIPVLPYPETMGPADMQGYDQLKPYLAGSGLRFSFGAMRGTAAADWMLGIRTTDVQELAQDLRSVGFCALEVATHGFSEQDDPQPELTAALGAPVAATPDGAFVAYDLRAAGSAGEADPVRRAATLNPVLVSVNGLEPDVVDGALGQYLRPTAEVWIANVGGPETEVVVRLEVTGVGPEQREVVVSDGDTELTRAMVSEGSSAELILTHAAAPGLTKLALTVSGPARKERGGDRLTVARVTDVSVTAPEGVRAVPMLDQYATGWVAP